MVGPLMAIPGAVLLGLGAAEGRDAPPDDIGNALSPVAVGFGAVLVAAAVVLVIAELAQGERILTRGRWLTEEDVRARGLRPP